MQPKYSLPRPLSYIALIILCIITAIPFLWLLSTALKSGDENIFASPPQWIPLHLTFENFTKVWQQIPLAQYFINSVVISVVTIALNLICSTLAAYPLARMKFTGKNILFSFILMTMMIPFQVMMVPLFLMCTRLGLNESTGPLGIILGLSLPFAVSGFGIFLMREAFVKIPLELEQSAILDGCSPWQSLRYILLPMLKPQLVTLAIFTLIATWGEFLWPSLILTKQENFTLPLGLIYLQSAFSSNWRLVFAGVLLSLIPVLVTFVFLQRYFVSGNLSSSVKG
jgi:putative chitobiose transport system permease protein